MSEKVTLREIVSAKRIDMICGWRQWADAGATSSGLPQYLIEQTDARLIGELNVPECYLFQIPGTHGLVRPIVEFSDGFPESLISNLNEIYYSGDEEHGLLICLGDEPHLNIDVYISAIFELADTLNVQRIISVAGVYGELPYDKERLISCIYSQQALRAELDELSLEFSDYQGGASIGSVLCHRASQIDREHVGLYAFVPAYDFGSIVPQGSSIRIENDFTAWLGIMRRINFMLNLDFDLTDLEDKHQQLLQAIDDKVEEIDRETPELSIRTYMAHLSDDFEEQTFNPLGDMWEAELRRLLQDDDDEGLIQ